jgi:pimeloyl-ACP methyl ester carboxylesterase
MPNPTSSPTSEQSTWTVWKVIRLLWVTAGISFVGWLFLSMNATGVDDAIFSDSPTVTVNQTDAFTSFTPTEAYQTVVLFYPGALVDPDAYAPLCRTIAEHGYQAMVIHMPWRLASQGYRNIKRLGLLSDPTKNYVLAGHSQGGKMAAQFVYENPSLIDQLILLGTTHPRDIDLSGLSIPVLKIYGSNDGVASTQKIQQNKPNLPSTAEYVRIEGANHAQFGYYGYQLGDDTATISREEQQRLVLQHMLRFIKAHE